MSGPKRLIDLPQHGTLNPKDLFYLWSNPGAVAQPNPVGGSTDNGITLADLTAAVSAAETARATAAEGVLTTNLSNETTARANADTAITTGNTTFSGQDTFTNVVAGAFGTIGSTSSGAIPQYGIGPSSPAFLHNIGFVYLGCGFLPGEPPMRFVVSSVGANKYVGFTQFPSPMFTGNSGGASTQHTTGGGDFSIIGQLIEVIWDGTTLFANVIFT